MTGLGGKRALVTGSTSGIGLGIARQLAADGCSVMLHGFGDPLGVERLRGTLEHERGVVVRYDGSDLTRPEAVVALVDATVAALGGIDILVNNAGVMLLGPIEGADTEQWRRMVHVNVLGLLYCTQAALPLMREAGGGHIVNVSSVAGRTAAPGSAVYNATKWGVVGFSDALRQEAGPSKIRVTCVEPGYVRTELQGHNENPAVRGAIEQMAKQIGEVLEADDIAEAIRYAVCAPPRVNVNELLIRPTGQAR